MSELPITDELTTDRGSVRLARPVPGVVHTVVEGYAGIEIAERIMSFVDDAIRAGEHPAVFHDWEGVTGYAPQARPMFASWYRRVRRNVESVHVYTRSKVVSMGVSLVSMAMNDAIVAHRSRTTFEQELASAVAAAKRVGRR